MERPGTEVELTIWRWGERHTIDVTLGKGDAGADTAIRGGGESETPSNALGLAVEPLEGEQRRRYEKDRKSTRLNSSHVAISYAVFCLKKKKKTRTEIVSRKEKKQKRKKGVKNRDER